MCASNFTPNKEGLFYIFPFVPNMFHSNSQWVPIINPIFLMRGSHKMAIERVLVAIIWGKMKKGKKMGDGGGGEKHCGDQNVFSCHNHVGTNFSRHFMA
jgi:hypothetical protein